MNEERIGAVVSLAALMNHVAAIHHDAATRALAEDGVSDSLSGMLWLLESGDTDLNMRDIARRLACDPSNVTLQAGQLEKRGFAERVPDPNDSRRRLLRLTPTGRDVARRMMAAVAAASPLAQLTDPQAEALGEALTAAVGAASTGTGA